MNKIRITQRTQPATQPPSEPSRSEVIANPLQRASAPPSAQANPLPELIDREPAHQQAKQPLSEEQLRTIGNKVHSAARSGMTSFINDIIQDAIGVAEKYVQVALLSGLASSALLPTLTDIDDTTAWLDHDGYHQLARWLQENQEFLTELTGDEGVFTMATALDEYVNGQWQPQASSVAITGEQIKVGEEVVRLLRNLNVSQLFREALAHNLPHKQSMLKFFSQELDKQLSRKVVNTYTYNWTLQEITTQCFIMWNEEDVALRAQLDQIRNTVQILTTAPRIVVHGDIISDGGMINLGEINAGGSVIGRDLTTRLHPPELSFNCPQHQTAGAP